MAQPFGSLSPDEPLATSAEPTPDLDILRAMAGKLGQTWPSRLVQSALNAAALPGDVYSGATPMIGDDGYTNPDVINRSADLAGLVAGVSTPFAEPGAAGIFGGRLAKTADQLERAMPKEYPVAPRSEWYGHADFEKSGGRMETMTPDEFLKQARPLTIDEASRENIDILKQHMLDGKTLDPLMLGGKEDGRHRAYAAKELGISSVPVINFRPKMDK